MSLPTLPVHTNTMGRGIFMMIDAIKVGFVTRRVVPPGSLKLAGTVYVRMPIIILIASGKWLIAMIRKRVISSS